VRIPAPHGHLEAHLRPASVPPRGAAVLCHPHPLHGGTMHTKAVFRSAQALNDAGFHVLRFNFRGVGHSTGSYDQGRGEMEDVRAALDWMEGTYPELPLLVGGFSFGSVVGLRTGLPDPRVKAFLALGLPVRTFDLGDLREARVSEERPLLLVQGEDDAFGDGAEAEAFARTLGPGATVIRIPGADHFFHDHFDELRAAITRFFAEGAGREPFSTLAGAR
jgi:uncharacterized protein